MNRSNMNSSRNAEIHTRQLCFFVAFLLPVSKLLEAPSLLARFAAGDLLLPAFFHFLLESAVIALLLYASSRSEQTLFERMRSTFGKGVVFFYVLYGVYFLFAVLLPLLDFEKFAYAAFFDTAPTMFAFASFFLFSAFACTKGLKAVGRSADLCLILFLFPFLALMGMSLQETDFTALLPILGTKFGDTVYAFTYTKPHFSDAVLLLPLLLHRRYQKGDGAKITASYWGGAVAVLLFLAVFFGIFSSIASREHYAFSKTAQYFSALSVVGRIDLLFVYALSIVLLFYTCLPLQYVTNVTAELIGTDRKAPISTALNVLAFLFTLVCNKYYDSFYKIISGRLFWVFFIVADLLPVVLCLLLPKSEPKKRSQIKREKSGSQAKTSSIEEAPNA
ncbi:MAG: GerAB/ArcD/ProY family transporter [Clostridia bacterium]|nr:GerAB/ArcD/ProY family transporter [Clostridia bacterium]